MHLKFVEKNTALHIEDRQKDQSGKKEYDVKFYDLITDTSFYAEGKEFHDGFSGPRDDSHLNITFFRGANIYTFSARAVKAFYNAGAYLTEIEQLSGMAVSSRRESDRNEMRVDVTLYGIDESDLESGDYATHNKSIEFSGETFDIGTGGFCIATNERLYSSYEPYFLAEFSLAEDSKFVLPAKLVRKGDCPQTSLFRFDFGFIFLYDKLPDEKHRMVTAIFNARYAAFNE